MSRNKDFSKSNEVEKTSQKSRSFRKKGDSKRTRAHDTSKSKSDQSVTFDPGHRDNSPEWYIKDKTLAEQVCHLSFNSFIGEGVIPGSSYAIPSIVSFYANPSPFNSYDIEDPNNFTLIKRSGLNLAITKLYTLLASYSGRASSYAPQDVGSLILAMGEIVSCIESLRRVVGVTYTYSDRNRALPKILTHALGVNFDDFIKNRAIYISRLNAIITRFNSLPILGNISYILKCRDMYQKVYADSMSPEATLLVMVPHTTWLLDESSYSEGTILKTVSWTSTSGSTFSTLLDKLTTMVEALFGSTTLNVIYADLLNLATKTKVDMFKMDYVTDDYIVIPEYNANFLMQIHNADILGTPSASTFGMVHGMYVTPSNDVYPDADANGLVYNPSFKYNLSTPGRTKHWTSLVDLPDANPSVDNIIEATRYKALSTAAWPEEDLTMFAAIPDHYLTYIVGYSNSTSNDSGLTTGSNWIDENTSVQLYHKLSQLDWAPLFYYQNIADSNVIAGIAGDLNFYTFLHPQTLLAMNRIIAQDLFDFEL